MAKEVPEMVNLARKESFPGLWQTQMAARGRGRGVELQFVEGRIRDGAVGIDGGRPSRHHLGGNLVLQDVGKVLVRAGVANSLAMERHRESFNALECLQARSAWKARGANKVLVRARPFILFAELEEHPGVQLAPRWEDIRGQVLKTRAVQIRSGPHELEEQLLCPLCLRDLQVA
jgi:hypothetical protein